MDRPTQDGCRRSGWSDPTWVLTAGEAGPLGSIYAPDSAMTAVPPRNSGSAGWPDVAGFEALEDRIPAVLADPALADSVRRLDGGRPIRPAVVGE